MRNNEIRTKRIKKYGVCLNDKCDNYKQIQEILHGDMECPVCKKKLSPCAPPKKKGMNKGLVAAIIAAVIAIIVACIFFFTGNDKEPVPPLADTTKVDTTAVAKADTTAVSKPDSVVADSTEKESDSEEVTAKEEQPVKVVEKTVVIEKPVVVEKIVEKKVEKSTTTTKETPAAGPKVSFGSYSGPANGLGGEISVTRAYSLDLRKGDGSSLDLQPGDKIRNTRFQNGELKQGVWGHNGETQFFSR